MARPSFQATDVLRGKVKSLAAVGLAHDNIGKLIGCSPKTLRKHFSPELKTAAPEAAAFVASHLFAAAKRGNIAAIIFWLKTRAGWVERMRKEISGPDGSPIFIEPRRVRVLIPCNGRGMCPKILGAEERRVAYDKTLGRRKRRVQQ